METTCGSFTLKGAKPPRNADVIASLLAAGAIIIGKGNMSVRVTNHFNIKKKLIRRRNGLGIRLGCSLPVGLQ